MSSPTPHPSEAGEGGERAPWLSAEVYDRLAALGLAVAMALVAIAWGSRPRLGRGELASLLVRAELAGVSPLVQARREGIRDQDLGHAAWWHGDADLERRVAAGLGRPDPEPP